MKRAHLRLTGALGAVVSLVAVATCGRDTVAPHAPASLAVDAVLPAGLDLQAFNLSIDNVRIIAVDSKGHSVFDKGYPFPANQTSVQLSADIPITQSPQTLQLTIQLLAGTTLLFSGTKSVSLSSGVNSAPAQVPVSYSGPGQNVATLTLGPPDSLLTEGATLQMRVTAKDGAGGNVPIFYVSWSTSDTVAAPIDATGTLKAPLLRKKITVQATTPTAVSATTTLQVIPVASAVSFDSGCAQSGLPGVQLPQPIVARVLGNDALGVPGVTVQFTAPAGGSVTTTSAVTDTGGRVRTLVSLPSVAGPTQFQATVTGLTAAVCGPTVLSSPPTKLAFKTQPANAVAGASFGTLQVEVHDANGTLVPGATNAVTLGIGANPGGATPGTQTVSAINGIATFAGFPIDKVGTGYTLIASAVGLTSATSNAFNITPAALNNLAFTTQPVNLTAGTAFPTVVVTARDAFGNTVTSFTTNVSLAFGSHPAGATLTGTTSVPAAAGVATFAALGPLPVAGVYTLVASASGVGSTASSSFTVNPAPPVAVAFLVQPTSGFAGSIITPAVVVAIEDSVGNVVTTATNPVTMSFGANPGQSTLGGTVTKNAASGVATFTNLTVSTAANGYTLVASATGLASATSTTFDAIVQPPGVVWKAPVSGNWSNAANWSPGRVPGPKDTVSILVPGSYVVTLDVNDTVAFLVVGDTISGMALDMSVGHRLFIDSSAVIQQGGIVLASSDTIGGAGNLTNKGNLTIDGSAITTAFLTNAAALQASGTSSITGSFSNSSGAGLIVNASSTGDATLTFASGFLNAGLILLQNADVMPRNVTLAVTSGVLTNISSGSLQSTLGSGGGNRTLAAMLDNQGVVAVQQTLTLDFPAGTHGNSGQIVLSGGDLNVKLSGFRPAFTNESGGVIDVGLNKMVVTGAGTFLNSAGGTLQGSGTYDVSDANLSFLTNGATVVEGSGTPGILTFVGTYIVGPTASVDVKIGGSAATPGVSFDQLKADSIFIQGGQGGTLNATAIAATAGNDYPVVVTAKGINGAFQAFGIPGNCTPVLSATQYVLQCR